MEKFTHVFESSPSLKQSKAKMLWISGIALDRQVQIYRKSIKCWPMQTFMTFIIFQIIMTTWLSYQNILFLLNCEWKVLERLSFQKCKLKSGLWLAVTIKCSCSFSYPSNASWTPSPISSETAWIELWQTKTESKFC